MTVKWDQSLNTNIAVIDQQHRKLINLVNDLNDAMRAGKSKEVLKDVLTVLADYTRSHFSAEERLMAQRNYPDLVAHKSQHTEFIDKISDFQKRVDAGSSVVSIDMMNFLTNWILTHIKGTDFKYVPFLTAKS